jgi:hypothetical protein
LHHYRAGLLFARPYAGWREVSSLPLERFTVFLVADV